MEHSELYGNWLPADLSTQGADIDRLINLLHVFMILLFVGWGIYMVYALFRFRKSANPKASYQSAKGTLSKWLEIGVVVFEVVILVGLSIPAWSDLKINVPSESEAVTIRAVAEQFAWNFHYPGPDGKFGATRPDLIDAAANPLGRDMSDPAGADDILTINQLMIPAGKKILIKLSSKDVIHSFAIPVLRVKQDAVPGVEIPIWFEAKEDAGKDPAEGETDYKYDIACAQLCGLGHYRMRGEVAIRTEAGFNQWLGSQGAEEFMDEDEEVEFAND